MAIATTLWRHTCAVESIWINQSCSLSRTRNGSVEGFTPYATGSTAAVGATRTAASRITVYCAATTPWPPLWTQPANYASAA